jgi:PKD repeat protein
MPVGFTGEYKTHTTDPDGDQLWYKWSWGDGSYSPWLGPFNSGAICETLHRWTIPGFYVVKVKAKDTLGGESDWSNGITVEVQPGLVADADGPYSGFEDEPIQFIGSATGGEEPYSWSWDFGDGKSSTQQNPTHTYSSPGDYQVILMVTDNDDESDTDTTTCHVAEVTVGVNANADGPYSGNVGESIKFYGSATGGVPPYSWEWDFGDGGSSTQQNPTHQYANTGTYTVILTVTDNEGDSDSDTSTARITEIPEDTTPPSVEIIKPQERSIYFLNDRILSFLTVLVIGSIDVEVEAYDSDSGVNRVEFYVDGSLQDSDNSAPYSWTWSEWAFFRHTLKVVAYDNAGNSNEEEIIVWKFF